MLHAYDYEEWYQKESDDSTVKDDLPPLEGDEKKVNDRKGLKILSPNKLLTRLSVLLAIQIKKRNQTNIIPFVSA